MLIRDPLIGSIGYQGFQFSSSPTRSRVHKRGDELLVTANLENIGFVVILAAKEGYDRSRFVSQEGGCGEVTDEEVVIELDGWLLAAG